MPQGYSYNLLLIIAGLALGLFGWVLYWAGIPLIGGLIGAGAGGALGVFAADYFHLSPNLLFLLLGIGVVLGGFLGVVLMRALQIYFFFTTGASIGASLTWYLLHNSPVRAMAVRSTGWGVLIAVAVGAIAGGLVFVYYRRFIVAVITSIVGVMLLTAGLPEQFRLIGGVVALVVFLAAQIGLVNRFVEREAFDRRMREYEDERDEEEPRE
jgi:hypothetical protein